MRAHEISRLLTASREHASPPERWRPRARSEEEFRVLAVCEPGPLEEKLLQTAKGLGEDIRFARSFADALQMNRERIYDIIILARVRNAAMARGFVREFNRKNGHTVIIIVAPYSEYEQLTEAMVEGAYDFMPDSADDRQLKLTMSRAIGHARLRRRSNELERVLDVQTSSLRQRLRELTVLNEMARDLASAHNVDEVLGRTLRRVLNAFGSECGSFLVLDPGAEELVVRAAEGPTASDLVGLRRKLGEGVSGKVARARHPVLVTDIENDRRFKSDALIHVNPERCRSLSFIAVPLIHRGRLLGEINITSKNSGEAFTQDDLRLLSILGAHVASAISAALVTEDLKKTNEVLAKEVRTARNDLAEAGRELAKHENLTHAVGRSVPAALAAFDAELNVTFANNAAADMFALKNGDSLKNLAAGSDLTPLGRTVAQAIENGSTIVMPLGEGVRGCCSDARASVVVAPFHDADGKVSGGTITVAPRDCRLFRSQMKQKEKNQ